MRALGDISSASPNPAARRQLLERGKQILDGCASRLRALRPQPATRTLRSSRGRRLVNARRAVSRTAGAQFISSASAGIGRTPTPSSISARASARFARPRIARSGSSPAWMARATSGNFDADVVGVRLDLLPQRGDHGAQLAALLVEQRSGLAPRLRPVRRSTIAGAMVALSTASSRIPDRRRAAARAAFVGGAVGKPAFEFVAVGAGERELDHAPRADPARPALPVRKCRRSRRHACRR